MSESALLQFSEKLTSFATSGSVNAIGLGFRGAAALADGLRNNRTLTELCLPKQKLNVEGGRLVASALLEGVPLVRLDVAYNLLGASAADFAQVLELENATLQVVELHNSQGGDAMCEAFARALRVNSSLTKLDVSEPSGTDVTFGAVGLLALADALKSNRTLKELNAMGGNISTNDEADEIAEGFAAALQRNAALECLKFGLPKPRADRGSVTQRGAQALANSISSNGALHTLGLDGSAGEGGVLVPIAEKAASRQPALLLNGVLYGLV